MRRLFLLLLSFPLLATAQDKGEKRTCRLLFLNPPEDAPGKLFLYDGVKSQEVEIPEMNFSDVYKIASGATALRLLPAPATKPEEIPAGAPSGKLAESLTDFYIVVTTDIANKVVPVQFQIIDAGSEKFKRGQMMWYNLAPNAIGGQLGSQKLAMKGNSRVIIDAPANGHESFDVNLSYVIPNDPNFHPICQTKWVHDPRSRMVMFVYGGAGNTTPQISGFKDFRVAPEKSE